jgi:hypothetical protein
MRIPEMADRTSIGFYPLLRGLDPEQGWKSLKLLEQAMPDIRKATADLR